jgi:hypothetical protein
MEQTAQQLAIAELARRELAQRKLIHFARFVMPNYQVARCHAVLAEKLEQVERGECNRLIVNFPRRHGKSLLVSQLFPAWCLGRNPRLKFVQCGYAENLTIIHSQKARDVVQGRSFNLLWPELKYRKGKWEPTQMQSMHEWGTAQGGNYYAVGVGGGLAGRGYSVGIIDDPLRGRKEAGSILLRSRVSEWFKSVFYPAQDSDDIRPNAAIIIVMTRWHVNDLAATVQELGEDGYGEHWDVLSMPAIDNDGQALWPERWPLEKLNRIRATIGSREFAAQYQQSPKHSEGNILDSSKLLMVDRETAMKWKYTKQVRRWDLAFSDKKDSDYVAGMRMGLTTDGKRVLMHLKHFQKRWPLAKGEIVAQALEDGVDVICAIEANGTQLGYFDDVKADERMMSRMVVSDKPEGTKEMRASVWGSRLEDNNHSKQEGPVWCIIDSRWNDALFDQMDEFAPNCEHDDIVDSISGGWGILGGETGAIQDASKIMTGTRSNATNMPQFIPRTFTPSKLMTPIEPETQAQQKARLAAEKSVYESRFGEWGK